AGAFLQAPAREAAEHNEEQERERARAEAFAELRKELRARSPLLAGVKAVLIARMVAVYSRAARLRAEGKSLLVRASAASRVLTLEAARRLVERGVLREPRQIFYLERGELAGCLLGETR